MSKKITDSVTWVGKIDWELQSFHGQELSTHRGSSYNSYLIRDEKTALIDTSWLPFDTEFVSSLKREIDLKEIDYIICNHSEVDHSGALPALLREIPGTPIYCSQNGAKLLKAQYHEDWNLQIVKTGDTLSLGKNTLTFVEMQMLHWPDSMMAFLSGENILFSNDAFGQHLASEELFNDRIELPVIMDEALKYYANILCPFSAILKRKLEEVSKLNLPIKMICPSHGIIWRDNPTQIIEAYSKWCDTYEENQITILYDSMWGATKKMAEAIARGISLADKEVTVKLLCTSKLDKNDCLTEVFRSKAILVGSSTVNNGILYSTAGILEMLHGLKLKNKKAAAFSSYGWSGESLKIIEDRLKEAGLSLAVDGLKLLWQPDKEAILNCESFGKSFASSI